VTISNINPPSMLCFEFHIHIHRIWSVVRRTSQNGQSGMSVFKLCVCEWPWYSPFWGGIWLLVPSYSVRPCRFASLLTPFDVSYRFHLFPIFFVCYWTPLFSSISSGPEVGKVLGYRSLHSKHLSLTGLPPHSHRFLHGYCILRIGISSFFWQFGFLSR
jgi:hypothetical protein